MINTKNTTDVLITSSTLAFERLYVWRNNEIHVKLADV